MLEIKQVVMTEIIAYIIKTKGMLTLQIRFKCYIYILNSWILGFELEIDIMNLLLYYCEKLFKNKKDNVGLTHKHFFHSPPRRTSRNLPLGVL
jgi:hypothetical protein